MRYNKIKDHNHEIPQNLSISKEADRQLALLTILGDISETLALAVDLYCFQNGLDGEKDVEQ